ncbi:MAG: 2,4-dihydroxyhept-2-ene-1,7-dioic acid aldolase [Chloroflexi bacterium]|nr:2,4-dihydroxyhept-2-ene-1,7-dioic acid aldolase [Chloroflexota bacterium]
MRPNKLRELLHTGQPTLGTHIHSTWPSMVEVVGHTGLFDYIEFVAEYGPYDLHDLDNICRAAELHDMSSMIKVDAANRTFIAQRAVGSGFQSVLFADIRSVEDAQECIQTVRPDTPEDGGQFGVAARRMAYMGYGGGPDYVQALRDIVVVLMIEKQSAVEQLEDILALPGVDMIQWGPVDYSMSVGRAGARNTPEIKAVERKVFETAMKMGVPPRAEINHVDEAKYFLDLGVRHFCLGTDISILYNWLKDNGADLRTVLANI